MSQVSTPKGVPLFHADHGLDEAHLRLIDEVIAQKDGVGFFIEAVELPDSVGELMSALYGPAAGDDPVQESEVEYVVRNGRAGPSRMVNRPHRPVRTMIVIGIADHEKSRIFTAYGSHIAAPREWWDSTMKPHEAYEAAQVWMTHALAR